MYKNLSILKSDLKKNLATVLADDYEAQAQDILNSMKNIKAEARHYLRNALLIDVYLMWSLVVQVTKANYRLKWNKSTTTDEELYEYQHVKDECLTVMRQFYASLEEKFETNNFIVKEKAEFY